MSGVMHLWHLATLGRGGRALRRITLARLHALTPSPSRTRLRCLEECERRGLRDVIRRAARPLTTPAA